MQTKKENVCVACSIFKKELEQLKKEKNIDISISYLSSMLHMKPNELEKRLKEKNKKIANDSNNVVLLYGDCSPFMNKFEEEPNISRTEGVNCIEILLGKKRFRKLRKEGAFFLLPEWTLRWEEIFKYELKLDGEIAREFMQEFHTKIIYLDTRQIKIPVEQIKKIEKYTGLNVEFMKVDLKELNISLQKAIKKFNR